MHLLAMLQAKQMGTHVAVQLLLPVITLALASRLWDWGDAMIIQVGLELARPIVTTCGYWSWLNNGSFKDNFAANQPIVSTLDAWSMGTRSQRTVEMCPWLVQVPT